MPSLQLRFTKRRQQHTLTCVRPDGSATSRAFPKHSRFFVAHDLTHFVVETGLNLRRGFYGLIADGWNLGDFGAPWPRGPLPEGLDAVEVIVGLLDAERGTGLPWPADQFNIATTAHQQLRDDSEPPPPVTEGVLTDLRARVAALQSAWDHLPVGETLDIYFAF